MIPIKRSLSLLFGAGIAAAALIPAAPITAGATATSWDAAADFSPPIQSGAWSYGSSLARGTTFTPFTTPSTFMGLNVWSNTSAPPYEPDVFFNGTPSEITPNQTNPIPAGTLAFHPGAKGENAVVRWTAPSSGTYNVAATFTGRDIHPTTTDVAVLSNGTQLFAGAINAFLATQNFAAGPLTLNAGDTIDFTVGFGSDGSYFFDSTGLSAQITTVIDTTPPTITITTPAAGASYVLNQTMLADYACTDPDSTSVSCVGTVAAGSQIDTASIGSKTFTVVGTDQAANQATASVTYSVGFGACLLYDQTKAVRSGATVPIKLTLCDAAGVNQSSPDITLSAVGVTEISSGAPGVLDSPGDSQPDNNFRFDPDVAVGGGYHFNLSTAGLATGTYVLSFMASGDPTVHLAQFQVK